MTIVEPEIAHIRVSTVMHTGILTTDPSTPLRTVARLMSSQRVHAIAVSDPDHTRRPLGFVTTLDVAAAVTTGAELTAGEAAVTEVVTVVASEPLATAAQLMADHRLTHLIVVDSETGHPCGIVSSLDVAQAYAS